MLGSTYLSPPGILSKEELMTAARGMKTWQRLKSLVFRILSIAKLRCPG